MMHLQRALLFASCVLVRGGASLPQNHTNDQVNAAIQAGTFQNPSANVRPRFRYWVPDASADLRRIAEDVASAKSAGAGGVEVLGYYDYGASPGEFIPVDWNTYGWGTPAWKNVFDTLLQAHVDNGLVMDFAMGPNQGQGVPANPDDDGLMWDLRLVSTTIPVQGTFSGTIPGWGTSGKLQAVISALATKSVVTSDSAPSLPNNPTASRTQITLATSSLQDVTSQVSSSGQLSLDYRSTPSSAGIQRYIFAVYLYKLGARNQMPPQYLTGPQTSPSSWVNNGSWTVDHFSAKGAKVMTDFWEQQLLIGGTKEKLQAVGNYAWEDSIEIDSLLYWTPGLPDAFLSRRNYSINTWLPILFHQNSFLEHADTWFITDEADSGNSHIADYRTTLTELYGEYLQALTTWANNYLGIQFSAQIGYNMAVDMQSGISVVNAPETESLAFSNNIDGYRQYTGPANMAGKRVISTECCAATEAYQQPLPEILWYFKRSLAGSVNQISLHGLSYSGAYPNTTWPGFTPFTYAFSEVFSRHQPAWDYISEPLGYISRLQYIFQTGVPKMDVAFYHKWTGYHQITTSYTPTDLVQGGYSYSYLNPDNLGLPEAYVQNAVLAPARQAYKALVISNTDTLTVPGVTRIAKFADDGLPIIFYGGVPSYLGSFNSSGATFVTTTLQRITKLSNVHTIATGALATTLTSLGIKPLTRVSASATWYTYWRRDDANATDYIFVYNDTPGGSTSPGTGASDGTVEFQAIGQPYLLDAWTGAKTPILNYTQTSTTTTIYFKLAANQAVVVAFQNKDTAVYHATSTSSNVLALVPPASGNSSLVAHVGYTYAGLTVVTTSDGTRHSVSSSASLPIQLANWSLWAQKWDPPSQFNDVETVALVTESLHSVPTLTSWQHIDGLQHASGRGNYTATFTWPPPAAPTVSPAVSVEALAQANVNSGAFISFGTVVHTLTVYINDKQVPSLDVTAATADISAFLVNGTNTVLAVVTTPMGNGLTPIWNNLRSGGRAPTGPFGLSVTPSGNADYGLLYAVTIIPYQSIEVK